VHPVGVTRRMPWQDTAQPNACWAWPRIDYVVDDSCLVQFKVSEKMTSSVLVAQSGPPSPPPDRATVSVHALSAGHFTLPEYQFVHPVSKDARKTVPSLAFLIQHHDVRTSKRIRFVFDLGLRRDVSRYAPAIQKHTKTRQPMTTDPDVVKSLAQGCLMPEDIDYVLYSHVGAHSIHKLHHQQSIDPLGPHRRASRLPLFYVSRGPWCVCPPKRHVLSTTRRPLVLRERSPPWRKDNRAFAAFKIRYRPNRREVELFTMEVIQSSPSHTRRVQRRISPHRRRPRAFTWPCEYSRPNLRDAAGVLGRRCLSRQKTLDRREADW
jgi:hypothetical protein